MNRLIEEIKTGVRTIVNTDWPVLDQLRQTGDREWSVVRELCNGVARTVETYRSEKSAREAFGSRIEGRKPRAGSAGRPVTFRASDAERERWQAAAEKAGQSLGEWLREAAEARLG